MTKERQKHADFIILQAEDMSLRFDVQNLDDGSWDLVHIVPCQFREEYNYRLHEREFPKTSLSSHDLRKIWFELEPDTQIEDALLIVANAAIKQYILDTEKASK